MEKIYDKDIGKLNIVPLIIKIILPLIVLLITWTGFKIVPTGQKGLIFNFGQIQERELDNGVHFKIPFYQKIEKITIQPIQLDHVVDGEGKDGAITKDKQTVGANLVMFYTYNQGDLVNMWREFGEDKIRRITISALKESFKMTIGSYDIFELPTSQDEIKIKVHENLMGKLSMYPITITELNIMNYDWSDDFEAQIKATMRRAQEVKQKEQELLVAEQEANKQVKQANAKKQAMITIAEGEKESAKLMAKAKALEGEGIKNYNESVATNWGIELKKLELQIERERVSKWNGQYVSTQNYTPIPVQNGILLGK